MLSPGFYPHRPAAVQLIQTHISFAFLAGPFVYKVKKPVDFGFLDYSTRRKRAHWCRREVALNRRFAPGVYVGTAAIYRRDGKYTLSPRGERVETAVVMKRLPDDRLLSTRMAAGKATTSDARRIARRVALFLGSVPPIRKRGALAVMEANIEENFRQTEPFIGTTVSAADYDEVHAYNGHFLTERRDLLARRVAEGRFRDGHGDLHAEHICLLRRVILFDCLEFSSRLRQTDVAAEIAFLYMDLLYHRHPHLAQSFADEYIRLSGDWEVRLLLSFYACYRAIVREKVESLRFSDPQVPAADRRASRRRAAEYFHLARDLARRDGRPRLTVVGGLPGSGKTTLAALWAKRTGAIHLSTDAIRKGMANARGDGCGCGCDYGDIYGPGWSELTYGELSKKAEALLRGGHSVVADGVFGERAERRLAAAAARRSGARLVTVECRAAADIVRRRIGERVREGSSLSDADWSIHRAKKRAYVSPSKGTLKVRTDRNLEGAMAKIAAAAFPL